RDRAAAGRLRRGHRHHRPAGPGLRLSPERRSVPRDRNVTRGRRGTPRASLGVPLKRLLLVLTAMTLVMSCVTSGNGTPGISQPTAALAEYLGQLNDDNFS